MSEEKLKQYSEKLLAAWTDSAHSKRRKVLLSAVDEGFRGEIDPPGCRVAILQTTASPSWSRILVRHAG